MPHFCLYLTNRLNVLLFMLLIIFSIECYPCPFIILCLGEDNLMVSSSLHNMVVIFSSYLCVRGKLTQLS